MRGWKSSSMSSVRDTAVLADLRLARAYAAKHLPWFAPALYRCRIVLTEQTNVAAVDPDYNVYWNPAAVCGITSAAPNRTRQLEELAFVWVHEISHNLRDHGARRAAIGGEPGRWNCCADLEINDADWAGTAYPSAFPPLLPEDFRLRDGELAEWYYRRPETDRDYGQPLDCGSGAHGDAREWEAAGDRQNLNDTQREVVRRQVAEEMNKAPGNLPGGWDVWVRDTLNPKVDWRQLLRQRLATAIAVGSGARVDYSYRRPGRRQALYAPIILPTLTGSNRNQLAVVIDTSGSMEGEGLDRAIGEVYGILRGAHRRVTLIPCDTEAYEPVVLEGEADLRRVLHLPGGGGTNLLAGIHSALHLRPRPDAVLVLTDGFTPYPTETYEVPVLFGLLGERLTPFNRPPDPPWGEDAVIEIG